MRRILWRYGAYVARDRDLLNVGDMSGIVGRMSKIISNEERQAVQQRRHLSKHWRGEAIMTSSDRISTAFGLPSSAPGTYKVRCPAHDDRKPSLSVTIKPDKALVKCLANCPTDAVLQKVGLTLSDLFFDDKSGSRREMARYEYRNAAGELQYAKIRYESKDFRFFDSSGNPGLNGHERILYGLPGVEAAKKDGLAVFLCEGEKDADTIGNKLFSFGTTLDNGALPANASPARLRPLDALEGVTVYVLPDQDAPGRVHADQCAKYLRGKAKELYVVNVPAGKDVSEYFERGGTPDAFRQLCAAAPMWQPQAVKPAVYTFSWADNPPEVQPLLRFKDSGILWPEGIALLTGPQGKGKSNVVHAIAAAAINPECDGLGFNDPIKPFIMIDTENPLSLFRKNTRRGLINRAGLTEGAEIEGADYVNIRGLETFEERQDYLFELMAQDKYKLYLIDGAGDFVLDVNDVDTSIPFVSRLCAMTLRHNCGVLVTLHGNPGVQSEKARGHLGSELLRKADCSLFLKVEGDNRCITTYFSQGKNRAGSDDLTQYFVWDDFKNMHISCDTPAPKTGKTTVGRMAVIDLMNGKKWSHGDLLAAIMTKFENSKSTAKRWVSELVDIGKIHHHDDGTYSAIKKITEFPEYIHD